MATSDPFRGRTAYRLLALVGVALLAAAVGIGLAAQPATGQADVSMGTLDVAGANTTADGDVTDVRLSVNAAYQYDVVDADRYVLELMVGPDADQLEAIDFVQSTVEGGQDSGTADLDASILDSSHYAASDFEPPVAGTATEDVTVGLRLEVRRAGGDPVTALVTEPVAVTIHDDAVLTADVGGDGAVSVSSG